MSPFCLEELGRILDEAGAVWIFYLECIREAYRVCVQRKLDPDYSYEQVFHDFHVAFNIVHEASEGRITETLKELTSSILLFN